MPLEHLNSLDLESELVEIEELTVEDFLDFARYGELEALKAISESEHASKLALCDENKISLLHMVAANGHFECAELLLKCPQVREISLNSVNTEGNTALHWAALNSHIPLVRLLLENGADFTIKNSVDRTPFDEAVVNEKFEVTAAIIEFLEKSQESKEENFDSNSSCQNNTDMSIEANQEEFSESV